jgi:thioredoxin reductase (NADPH)
MYGAYPRLSEAQVSALAALGGRRSVQPGELLFTEGDRTCDFFVVQDGKAAVLEGYGTPGQQVISVHGPGRFLGELSLLIGERLLVTAMALEPGKVVTVPLDRLRDIVARDSALGDLILRAYIIRRSILVGLGAGMRVIGSHFSPDARRLRDFAARNRLPHRWLDLEEDRQAEALLSQLGVTPEQTPVVILYGGEVLHNPSNAEMASAIGLRAPVPQSSVFDLAVVGAGPSGLAAAVYGASEGLRTNVLEGIATGGQAGTSPRIENYLGFPSGISGGELADRAAIQAMKFGASISVPAEASAISDQTGHYAITLSDGGVVSAQNVIIATGIRYRRLDVPNLEKFGGSSVYYAASQIEAMSCRGDPVAVVGGGNSAGQASLFLAQHASAVTLVVRGPYLGQDMSHYLADEIERNPKVMVMVHTEVTELLGDETLEAVRAVDNQTGATQMVPARALFVFIGAQPHTAWLSGLVDLDDDGYVRTGNGAMAGRDERSGVVPGHPMLETSRPGVYAVGDVRSGSIRRVASAVGEGAMAVRLVHERRAAS